MFLTKEEINRYTCKLRQNLIPIYCQEKGIDYEKVEGADSNDILRFIKDRNDLNLKSKQFFFYLSYKMTDDLDVSLAIEFLKMFAIKYCGPDIYDSLGLTHCNMIISSNSLEDSYGCYHCKFSDHLIYCKDQRHKSYMAFNKEITKERYEELSKLSPYELEKQPEFDPVIYAFVNNLMERIYRIRDPK